MNAERTSRSGLLVLRIGTGTLIAALGLAGAAVGASTQVDRVQVGVSGRNATEGLSPSLYVDVPVVAGYRQSKFDGEQGDWQGPDYTATQKPGAGRTDLSFRSDFENDVGSLDGMATKGLVHTTWKQSSKGSVRVPRVLAGRTVGTVGGELLVVSEPISGSARWESVLAVPLCHGIFGAIDLYADAPAQDTSGTAGQYLVSGTHATTWNEDHALSAARGVKLDGPLPGGSATARAAGRTITGKVADCGGELQNVPVTLEQQSGAGWATAGRGKSGPGGVFRLPAKGAGNYRVVAALGPFQATSGTATIK